MPHSFASHTAPPVRYPVQRSLWLSRALLACALLGGLALLAWGFQGPGTRQHGLQLAVATVLWWAGSVVAWHFWAKGVCGVLAWNGQEWTLEISPNASAVAGTVAVHLDLQVHLWLRCKTSEGEVYWLWLEQQSARERWGDVRRAVYSRAGTTVADALRRDQSA